jgi:hypothetical protein
MNGIVKINLKKKHTCIGKANRFLDEYSPVWFEEEKCSSLDIGLLFPSFDQLPQCFLRKKSL